MPAVLRVFGEHLNLDEALNSSGLTPCAVHHCGERRFPQSITNESVFTENAIYVAISNADLSDFRTQVEDSIQFLSENSSAVQRLVEFEGVDEAYIDFGIPKRDGLVQSDVFPGSLVKAAGRYGIGLGLSQYAVSDAECNATPFPDE